MFLTKDSKSPYFQIVYFANGKRTKVSTKTSNRREAEKFLKHFNPDPIKEKPKKEKIINLTLSLKNMKTISAIPIQKPTSKGQ